jgi:hypothetical protein
MRMFTLKGKPMEIMAQLRLLVQMQEAATGGKR